MKKTSLLLSLFFFSGFLYSQHQSNYFKDFFLQEVTGKKDEILVGVRSLLEPKGDLEVEEGFQKFNINFEKAAKGVDYFIKESREKNFKEKERTVSEAAVSIRQELERNNFNLWWYRDLLEDAIEKTLKDNKDNFDLLISDDLEEREAVKQLVVGSVVQTFECGYYGSSRGCIGISKVRQFSKLMAEKYNDKQDPFEPSEEKKISDQVDKQLKFLNTTR